MIWRDHVTWARPSEAESTENGPHPQPCLPDPDQQIAAPTLQPPLPRKTNLGPRPPHMQTEGLRARSSPTPSPTTMASISPWLITTHGWTVTRDPRHRPGPGSSPQGRTPPRAPLPRHQPAAAPEVGHLQTTRPTPSPPRGGGPGGASA